MKAITIESPNKISLIDISKPMPQYGEVLCKVIKAGICGTDYTIYSGRLSEGNESSVRYPLQPGHEWAGLVVSVGTGVKTINIGDRVIGDTCISCGQCYDCLNGRYAACREVRAVGTVNQAWSGAMAEFFAFPAKHLIRIPDNISYEAAALAEPAGTAMYAIQHAPVKLGDTVVILGTGPIGLSAVKLSKIYGATKIIGVGRGEFKLSLMRQFGATHLINTLNQNVVAAVDQITAAEGADVIIECSGSVELFDHCIDLVRFGGKIAVIAFYESSTPFNINKMIFKNASYFPVPGCFAMLKPLLKLMEAGLLDLTSMITHHGNLSDVPLFISDHERSKSKVIKVMIDVADEFDTK